MSWLSQNYEKASLGGAAVVALGLAFLGWSKVNGVEEGFSAQLRGSGNNDPAVKNADLVPLAIASLDQNREWVRAEDDGRPVDLFTGIPLFISSADPTKPVDPYAGEPIHPPIPNQWWIQNRLDPGYADSPARDPDGDGFSNLEEYKGKTDPNSDKAHPPLIAKLSYIRDESVGWVVRPGFETDGGFTFKYTEFKDGKITGTNKVGAESVVMPGSLFFAKNPMMNRFKLVSSETREVLNKSTNASSPITFVKIEDQRANKKGTVYEIPSQFPEDRNNEHARYDRTAVLSLEAIGMNGKEFKVEENTTFGLPSDNPKKDYLAKSVTPEGVVIEFKGPDGAVKTVDIPKGGMPRMEP